MFKRIFIILIAAFIFVQYVGTSHGASSDSSSDSYLDQYKDAKKLILKAKSLEEISNEFPVKKVLVFDVNEEELVQRIILRGETSGRSDDTAESIKVRLEVYKQDTEPLIDFYKESNDVVFINALGDIDEIYKTIEANFS